MRILKGSLISLFLILVPALAWALPGDGIANTDHDFYTGIAPEFAPNTLIGVCTYCHTPHKAISTLLLWNHTLSANNFQWDVPTTTGGTTFPTIATTYNGPTVKCLSCHDGSVAVGDIAWFDAKAYPGGVGMDTTKMPLDHQVGTGGAMAGNHPVAMPYPYNNVANTYNGVKTGTSVTLLEWQADPSALNIRLFNDNAGAITGGAVATKTGIECSSCHDPHNKASTGDMFLRGTLNGNTTAYICLKCHIK